MSDDQYFTFQVEDAGETPAQKSDYPTVRERVEAPCPGQFSNTVSLLSGRKVLDGLKRPRNVGSCALHIACYDAGGTFIGKYTLAPGASFDFLEFPSNTENVRFGCDRNCSGTAVMEYQSPYIS